MSYLNQDELVALGLKSFGQNVQISSKVSIYQPQYISIGDNVRIDDFCVLSGHIHIGNYVHIACQVIMTATIEPIFIGDYSTLSYGVKVFSASDDFSGPYFSNPTVPIDFRNVTHASVLVSDFCTVGAGSVILPGSQISSGVSFGALSFVKGKYEGWRVYVGAPARQLGIREKPPLY